jgi:hypothetical protein
VQILFQTEPSEALHPSSQQVCVRLKSGTCKIFLHLSAVRTRLFYTCMNILFLKTGRKTTTWKTKWGKSFNTNTLGS